MNPATTKSKPDRTWGMIRLDNERLARLKEIATREDRSLVSVLRRAVDRELEREEAASA